MTEIPLRVAATLLLTLAACIAQAANFVSAAYDAERDELVVKLAYRGTNSHHQFSLEWGECRQRSEQGKYEIAARVDDDQWNDRAQQSFQTTVRLPLSGLTCRPATVTLFTAPNFRTSIFVPARSSEGT